jgi:hypothetical protein
VRPSFAEPTEKATFDFGESFRRGRFQPGGGFGVENRPGLKSKLFFDG